MPEVGLVSMISEQVPALPPLAGACAENSWHSLVCPRAEVALVSVLSVPLRDLLEFASVPEVGLVKCVSELCHQAPGGPGIR